MNRRTFLQVTSGAISYSLIPAVSSAADFSAEQSNEQVSSTAPTISETPQVIDGVWQRASAKYDAVRRALLEKADHRSNDGPFRSDWESLATYQVPEWYKDAKFGIFVHWGVYSVPAFGSEWYPRDMYIKGTDEYNHQIPTYGPLTKFGYKDFIPMFNAEHYDPQAWARLFKDSGARYVVPVFEHHDGFAMYHSDLSDWTAVKMGPRRDLVGDLATAIRAEGLHLGASSHRIEHDWFMDGGREIDSDVNDPRYASFYGPAHRHIHKGDDASLLSGEKRRCHAGRGDALVRRSWHTEDSSVRINLAASSINQSCSIRCEEAPRCNPSARTAIAKSPTRSRRGPILTAVQSERSESYMAKPSWCSKTGTTYLAPESLNNRVHACGSSRSALNIGIKSLIAELGQRPVSGDLMVVSSVPLMYMYTDTVRSERRDRSTPQ